MVGKNKPLRQAMSMAFDRAEFIPIFHKWPGDGGDRPDSAGVSDV